MSRIDHPFMSFIAGLFRDRRHNAFLPPPEVDKGPTLVDRLAHCFGRYRSGNDRKGTFGHVRILTRKRRRQFPRSDLVGLFRFLDGRYMYLKPAKS